MMQLQIPYDGTAMELQIRLDSIIADGEDFRVQLNQDRIEIGNVQVTSSALTISAWISSQVNAFIPDARIVSKGQWFCLGKSLVDA